MTNPNAAAELPQQAEQEREFAQAVARGRAQIAAGQVVEGDAVAEWVASWDSKHEKPRPKPAKQR